MRPIDSLLWRFVTRRWSFAVAMIFLCLAMFLVTNLALRADPIIGTTVVGLAAGSCVVAVHALLASRDRFVRWRRRARVGVR